MPRLGHKKSRLGCRQCKARHVKCDELKPCSNCARHGVPCSLVTWDPNAPKPPEHAPSASSSSASRRSRETSSATKTEPTSTPSPSLPFDYVLNAPTTSLVGDKSSAAVLSDSSSPASQPDNFPFLTRFIHRSETSPADIWLRDLELMHHWTVEAFDELSQRDDMRHTWRVDAPRHAIAHPFFMHEILAFAAFHKASKEADQRVEYYTFGIHHQDLAIRGIREKLHNVLPEEAAAIVATSTLLTLSVFASTGFEANYPEISTAQNVIDGILNIFSLMQGMGNVIAIAQGSVTESFLTPMFRDALEPIASQPMLQELVQHIPTLITFIEGKGDLPESERQIYLNTVAHFEPVLRLAMPPCVDNRELRFLFFWPLHLEAPFLTYLRKRQPGALVILMYYCTMLFASEPRYWFMNGWGDRLMRACYEAVDQSWTPAIQWPASFLSQAASYDLFANLVRQRQAAAAQAQAPYNEPPPVSIPHRQYTSYPPPPHEQNVGAIAHYSQQASTTTSPPDQKPII